MYKHHIYSPVLCHKSFSIILNADIYNNTVVNSVFKDTNKLGINNKSMNVTLTIA